jgi:hypothetical protein
MKRLFLFALALTSCATQAQKDAELDEHAAQIPVLGRVPDGHCRELGAVGADTNPIDDERARKLMLREAARKNANYVRLDSQKLGHVHGVAYRCVQILFANPFKNDGP